MKSISLKGEKVKFRTLPLKMCKALKLSSDKEQKKPWEFEKGWFFKVTFVPVSL